MSFSCARALLLALVAGSLFAACGDDEALPDAGDGSPDAGVDGGLVDGGDDLCPGARIFEALVADARTGQSVFEMVVAEVGAGNTTTSAPNGRALLCLPTAADSQVRSTLTDYVPRLDTLFGAAVDLSYGTDQPYPLDVLSEADADELFVGLGLTRDTEAAQLLVSVVSYPDAQPLVGAAVSIDKDGSAFARDESGEFAASVEGEIGAGRLLLFANVPLVGGGEAGRAAITVEPPASFSGTCVGPSSAELVAGGLSGVFFACQ